MAAARETIKTKDERAAAAKRRADEAAAAAALRSLRLRLVAVLIRTHEFLSAHIPSFALGRFDCPFVLSVHDCGLFGGSIWRL